MAERVANHGYVTLLERGVDDWNSFRRRHSAYLILNRVSLAAAQLANADLHCVLLMESDLQCANLSCATLERAVLRKSNLRGSDLRFAVLDRADLCRADFSGADLRGASMDGAFLKRTDLSGADLSTTQGLTAVQLSDAFGDDQTKLPRGIIRPESWATTLHLSRALG